MVSLSDENRRSGGYFFNEDASIQGRDSDDQLLLDSPTVSSDLDTPFRKIHTTFAIFVHLALVVINLIVVIALPLVCVDEPCSATPSSVLLYLQGALWGLGLLFDRYYRFKHNQNRMYGYLEFYRRTRNVRRAPLILTSAVTALLLVVVTIISDTCHQGDKKNILNDKCGPLDVDHYLQIILGIQLLLMGVILVAYLTQTVKFNQRHAAPDVAQEEMLSSFTQSNGSLEIGFKDEQYTDQVLEKQADMIRYLRQHNAQLAKRLLALTSENQGKRAPLS